MRISFENAVPFWKQMNVVFGCRQTLKYNDVLLRLFEGRLW